MNKYPNIMTVSGSGRKSGKTTFICRFIESFTRVNRVIAIKISPHFHEEETDNPVLIHTPDFIIEQEIHTGKNKDSSRMLKAGAKQVFYIQTHDDFLNESLGYILRRLEKNIPVVCESGAPGLFSESGLKVFLEKEGSEKNAGLKNRADILLSFPDIGEFNMSSIIFNNNQWQKT